MSGSPGIGNELQSRRFSTRWLTPTAVQTDQTWDVFTLKKGQRITAISLQIATAGLVATTNALTVALVTATTALFQSFKVSSAATPAAADGQVVDSTAAGTNQSGGTLATADDLVRVTYAHGDAAGGNGNVTFRFNFTIRQDIP